MNLDDRRLAYAEAPGGRLVIRRSPTSLGCRTARDPDREAALRGLASRGAAHPLRAIAVDAHPRGDACLAHGDGFGLRR